MQWIVVGLLIGTFISCLGQRTPPLPQNVPQQGFTPSTTPAQNVSSINMQIIQQQQKNEEIANIKDETIKRVLLELSTLQTPSQLSDTMLKVAQMVGPLFFTDFENRKDTILSHTRDTSEFPQRLLSAITDINGEETKALVLQRQLDVLHTTDFAFLPLAIQYGLQEEVLTNLSGSKLASVVRVNPGDTVIADKVSAALINQPDQQIEFLQSLGQKMLPQVQRIIMSRLLEWWGDPHTWKDRQLNLLTSAGSPLLSYMPQSQLQSLDDELADRFVTILGQTQDIARGWWRKPMSLKKAWFDVAKGARYFGAVHEWSFRRMQKLSFLLEGASPEDLELIPAVPEIKGLVIGNHYTELQARIVFDAFYNAAPLTQEDLQEFQFHVLDLTPKQLQRFDFADSFGTLDEMMSIMDRQRDPSYSTVLQISYFMWPIINSTNSIMNIAPPSTWQKRELAQIGKMFFLLPKSVLSQIQPGVINWDSNVLASIRSNHLTPFQIWKLTSQILQTVDERFKPDYIFMIPSPYQKGIPSQNISQALLGSSTVRPEVLRALIEQASGMLISQKAVILQRIMHRISESIIIRTMVATINPSEMFQLVSPKLISKNMGTIIKTIMEMPETGKFGITSIQTKLLPQTMLSLWLKWVRENGQVSRWTAEDLLGRSTLGATHELNLAILGLSCRDIAIVDPWDILSVIMHYRHELYALRRFRTSLKFNINLRACVMEKFVEYLTQRRFLDGNQTSTQHILTDATVGELEALGGEILSIIPTDVLNQLDGTTRTTIIKEIGKLQMQELFSLTTLPTLHLYAQTLFKDLAIRSSATTDSSGQRAKRQLPTDAVSSNPVATAADSTSPQADTADTASTTGASDTKTADNAGVTLTAGTPADLRLEEPAPVDATPNATADVTRSAPTPDPNEPIPHHGIDMEALNTMGNLICYSDNMFNSNWPRSLMKDVLEAKTSVGEKTCCMNKQLRNNWFEILKAVYGTDTSTWNEFDLNSIGDLLIVLPDEELQKITIDALGKAATPMMRQSAWSKKISIPGEIKTVQFVTACTETLGAEGQEFMASYKNFMKRVFQASQWMVNSVKTTQELIRDGMGRTGRIPRWAEHSIAKRQVPLQMAGGELAFSGVPQTTVASPTTTMYVPAMQQQQGGFVTYAQQPMMTGFQQPVYTTPMYQQPVYYAQPGGQMMMQQGAFGTGQMVPVTTTGFGGTVANTGTNAGGAFSSAGAAGVGSTGGSFSTAGTSAQPAGATANAAGGSFSTDTTGQTAGGSFSQANANTLAARSTPVAQQQPQAVAGQPAATAPTAAQPQQGQLLGAAAPPAQPAANPAGQPQPPAATPPLPPSGNPGQPQGAPAPGPNQPVPPQQAPPVPPGQPAAGPGPLPPVAPPGPAQQAGQQPAIPPGGPPNILGRSGGGSSTIVSGISAADKPQDLRTRALDFGALQDDKHNSEITCHGIKASGPAAIGLSIDDLDKLTPADLFDCVEALGRIEWDDDIKSQIMSLLKKKLEFNQDSINAMTLIELGDLVTAFSTEDSTNSSSPANSTIHSDISMIDLTLPNSLDMLAILGTQIIDPPLLKSLAEKFNQDNKIFPGFSEGIARPENLRIVVMSLGNIICGLNNKIVNSIFETDASLFIDTSKVLGTLEGCGNEVLSTLAAHAVRPGNYGPPRLWSQEDVQTVGVVFGGLKPDAISTIPADAMQGLTPLAVKSLPAASILALTSDQLAKLSYSAAVAFTPAQAHNFSPSQSDALKSVLEIKPDLFTTVLKVEETTTTTPPPPTSTEVPPADDTVVEEVPRDLSDFNETVVGVGGRARSANTGGSGTTTPPPATAETPKSSASSSKVSSIGHINYFVIIFSVFIPVMKHLNNYIFDL